MSYPEEPPSYYPERPLYPQQPRRDSTRIALVVLGSAVAVAVLILGGIALIVANRPSSRPAAAVSSNPSVTTLTSSAGPTGSSAADPRLVTQAKAVDAAVVQSSMARVQFGNGLTAAMKTCGSGTTEMAAAVAARQATLQAVTGLDVSALPTGDAIRAALASSVQGSITADQDYLTWARSGDCSDYTKNSDYEAGTTASNAVTADKNRFVGLWNPVATSAGLPTRVTTEF